MVGKRTMLRRGMAGGTQQAANRRGHIVTVRGERFAVRGTLLEANCNYRKKIEIFPPEILAECNGAREKRIAELSTDHKGSKTDIASRTLSSYVYLNHVQVVSTQMCSALPRN